MKHWSNLKVDDQFLIGGEVCITIRFNDIDEHPIIGDIIDYKDEKYKILKMDIFKSQFKKDYKNIGYIIEKI